MRLIAKNCQEDWCVFMSENVKVTVVPAAGLGVRMEGGPLTPRLFKCLEINVKKERDADETAALPALVKRRGLYGVLLKGRGFDAGNPDGYAAAVEHWARFRRQPTK